MWCGRTCRRQGKEAWVRWCASRLQASDSQLVHQLMATGLAILQERQMKLILETFEHGWVQHANVLKIVLTARDIASAMAYLHSLDIIHGDLKAQNVLLQTCEQDERGFICKVRASSIELVWSAVVLLFFWEDELHSLFVERNNFLKPKQKTETHHPSVNLIE